MKFAVIGHPIRHSKSPIMHHANFKVLGRNDEYSAINIHPNHFHHIKEIIEEKKLDGFNVTIPFKSDIIPYLDYISHEASMIGAVNTVHIKDGVWYGYNTDGRGFVESLVQAFSKDILNRKFLIIGAGGASRAITYSLTRLGSTCIIANRNVTRTESWPFEVQTISLEDINQMIYTVDVVINTTPVGMNGFKSSPLLNLDKLNKEAIVTDIIYNPLMTEILIEAHKRGHNTLNGLSMFVNQGALSFNIWTNDVANKEVMKEAVIKTF